MPNRTKFAAVFLGLTIAVATCFAQSEDAKAPAAETPKAEPKYFQLEFVLKELENGRIVNTRNYSMTVSTEAGGPGTGSIRTGDRVPVPVQPGSAQSREVEVGVNIDCNSVKEMRGRLALFVAADISTAATETSLGQPVIRSTKWRSSVLVPLRKATVLFVADDAMSKRQIQMELTATPVV